MTAVLLIVLLLATRILGKAAMSMIANIDLHDFCSTKFTSGDFNDSTVKFFAATYSSDNTPSYIKEMGFNMTTKSLQNVTIFQTTPAPHKYLPRFMAQIEDELWIVAEIVNSPRDMFGVFEGYCVLSNNTCVSDYFGYQTGVVSQLFRGANERIYSISDVSGGGSISFSLNRHTSFGVTDLSISFPNPPFFRIHNVDMNTAHTLIRVLSTYYDNSYRKNKPMLVLSQYDLDLNLVSIANITTTGTVIAAVLAENQGTIIFVESVPPPVGSPTTAKPTLYLRSYTNSSLKLVDQIEIPYQFDSANSYYDFVKGYLILTGIKGSASSTLLSSFSSMILFYDTYPQFDLIAVDTDFAAYFSASMKFDSYLRKMSFLMETYQVSTDYIFNTKFTMFDIINEDDKSPQIRTPYEPRLTTSTTTQLKITAFVTTASVQSITAVSQSTGLSLTLIVVIAFGSAIVVLLTVGITLNYLSKKQLEEAKRKRAEKRAKKKEKRRRKKEHMRMRAMNPNARARDARIDSHSDYSGSHSDPEVGRPRTGSQNPSEEPVAPTKMLMPIRTGPSITGQIMSNRR